MVITPIKMKSTFLSTFVIGNLFTEFYTSSSDESDGEDDDSDEEEEAV